MPPPPPSPPLRGLPWAVAWLALVGVVGVLAVRSAPRPAAGERLVTVELRSWVVAGWGRHLYARIVPEEGAAGSHAAGPTVAALGVGAMPEGGGGAAAAGGAAGESAGRHPPGLIVEYWSTEQRDNYTPPADGSRAARIARMPAGRVVTPQLTTPDHRLEAVYRVPARVAAELARDRVFAERYHLLGPNSSSGLRAAFESAGLRMPPRVLLSGGVLGEFPGIDLSPGAEIPPSSWPEVGLAPEPAAGSASR